MVEQQWSNCSSINDPAFQQDPLWQTSMWLNNPAVELEVAGEQADKLKTEWTPPDEVFGDSEEELAVRYKPTSAGSEFSQSPEQWYDRTAPNGTNGAGFWSDLDCWNKFLRDFVPAVGEARQECSWEATRDRLLHADFGTRQPFHMFLNDGMAAIPVMHGC